MPGIGATATIRAPRSGRAEVDGQLPVEAPHRVVGDAAAGPGPRAEHQQAHSDLAMTIANPAPSAPVMKCLSPFSCQPPGTLRAVDIKAAGSDPAPGGGSGIAQQ